MTDTTRKIALRFAFAALLLALLAGIALADEGTTTLTGGYVWTARATEGDLQAVFTPTGKSTWDVSFHFDFRDKPHTYTGTATGDLSGGKLSGKVFNEDKKRTFTFTGAFDETGLFSGTHAETTDGRAGDTGTLTLRAAADQASGGQ